MKYIAAYALLVLGGNENPTDADVRKVLQEIGGEVNEEELTRVVNALKGKALHEVIAAGSKKLSTVSFGGSSGAAAGGATTAAPAKTEAKKEEKPAAKEEEADVGLGGGLFGDDEEWFPLDHLE